MIMQPTDTPFLLGVNYWPRTKAIAFWREFDGAEVRDDFALCVSLGLNVVRIFLFWDDWQPTPDSVSMECMRAFEQVCDSAVANNLKLDVTFFTGHMSGPNWPPRWLLDSAAPRGERENVVGMEYIQSGYCNPYTDPIALEAEKLLLRTVVTAFRDHPAIWMWNLGNEPDLFAQPATHQIGAAWVQQMTALIREIDPAHPVTCGLHVASLLRDNGLHVDEVFKAVDVAVMHGYPMYVGWARDPLDPDFVPFTCALTTALCGKPTLAEEWGGCTVPPGEPSTVWKWQLRGQPREQFMAGETEFAAYVGAVLPRLQRVGATGALLWCFADYHPGLWDRPFNDEWRHERHFGLVRPDGSLKPHAETLRAFAATNPRVQLASATVTLDVSVDEYYSAPEAHAQRLYQNFTVKM